MHPSNWQPLFAALDQIFLHHPLDFLQQNALRVFHGRGRKYPGLEWCSVDLYWPVLLVTVFEEPPQSFIAAIEEKIKSYQKLLDGDTSINLVLQKRLKQSFSVELVLGDAPSSHVARRGDQQFTIRFDRQNTGYFLDMEPGRKWLKRLAQGRKVLNLFSYTCAFSVVAIAAGAQSVANVDMSKSALQQGRTNHQLNSLSTERVQFMPLNILKSWSRIRSKGPFDVIIIDPPSYQKGSFVAERDYHKLVKRLNELSNPGADALICLNAPELGPEFIHSLMSEYGQQWQFVERLPLDPVFDEAEQNRQLKLLHFRKTTATFINKG